MSSPLKQIADLRTWTERELAEHDEEILAIREATEKRLGVLERRMSKIGQGLRDLRKLVRFLRQTIADLAGRPLP